MGNNVFIGTKSELSLGVCCVRCCSFFDRCSLMFIFILSFLLQDAVGIGDETAETLGTELAANSTLKHLSLAKNLITEKGATSTLFYCRFSPSD
jgi:hypothetical protein